MERDESLIENRRFGVYLRRVREERKLSLDSVEEMTVGFPQRVTKSHLSRIENGQAVPTFPRMFALSQIYGVPISGLAERFEIDLKKWMLPIDLESGSIESLIARGAQLWKSGRYNEALQHYEALLGKWAEPGSERDITTFIELKLNRITCLQHLARYVLAREEAEELLGDDRLSPRQRVIAWHYFTMCSYRLGSFSIALMALEQTEREMRELPKDDFLEAQFFLTKGNLMSTTGRHEAAATAFKEAMVRFESIPNPFEACRSRVNLADALLNSGQPKGATKQLTKVLQEARSGGYDRQAALAISTLGLIAFQNDDPDAAEGHFLRSNAIARPREYCSVIFRNCFYLWKIALANGDEGGVKSHERTLRTYLSRIEHFFPEAEAFREHMTGGKSE